MGHKLGTTYEDLERDRLQLLKKSSRVKKIGWQKAIATSKKYEKFAEEYDPEFMEFVRGYSEGSGVDVHEVFSHFCVHEKGFCTDVMVNGKVTKDRSVISAHTEDWTPASERHMVVVRFKPKKGPEVLATTLGGLEVTCGMNSHGLSVTANSLYPNDERIGIPKIFLTWKILMCNNIADALAVALPPKRASSYNQNLCHRSGEMFGAEGSATDFFPLYSPNGYLVHTNHYIAPSMLKYETLFDDDSGKSKSPVHGISSLMRYHRALNLITSQLGNVTIDSLKQILEDHVGYPNSVCRHPDTRLPEDDRSKTTYGLIMDVTHLKMHVCPGNPCDRNWHELSIGEN
jgi:isopenicillin-N N-acyltransferase-like protein